MPITAAKRISFATVAMVGEVFTAQIQAFGSFLLYFAETLRETFKRPIRFNLIVQQMEFIGNQSLSILLLSALAIGAVFGLQVGIVFAIFNAEGVMGAATGKALTRELAPLMTGFLLAGRAGSAMTAELSTMKVNEQVDAIEAMGVNPINYLVVPRLIATIIMMPILSGVFVFVGIAGAFMIGVTIFDVNQGVFFTKLVNMVTTDDLISGFQKAYIFSVIIAVLACRFGLTASGGAKGVGLSTTNSVVATFLTILGFDMFITYIQIVF